MNKAEVFSYRRHDAARMVEAFASIIGVPESLIDVGGGIGLWADEFKMRGTRRALVIDYDQEPGELLVAEDEFRSVDLASGMPEASPLDLAICLEVAEHLPGAVADALVAFLTRCAPMVLFSAAIPGQRGYGHINCQPPHYWARKFREQGYSRHDVLRPLVLHDQTISYWYRQNTFLFVKEGHPQERALRALSSQPRAVPDDFELVHSRIADRYWAELGVRSLLKAFPSALLRTARQRLLRSRNCRGSSDGSPADAKSALPQDQRGSRSVEA